MKCSERPLQARHRRHSHLQWWGIATLYELPNMSLHLQMCVSWRRPPDSVDHAAFATNTRAPRLNWGLDRSPLQRYFSSLRTCWGYPQGKADPISVLYFPQHVKRGALPVRELRTWTVLTLVPICSLAPWCLLLFSACVCARDCVCADAVCVCVSEPGWEADQTRR